MQHIVLKEKLFGAEHGKPMAALCFEFTDGTVQLSYLNHAANFTNLDGFFLSGPVWVASPFDMLISSFFFLFSTLPKRSCRRPQPQTKRPWR